MYQFRPGDRVYLLNLGGLDVEIPGTIIRVSAAHAETTTGETGYFVPDDPTAVFSPPQHVCCGDCRAM